MICFSVIFYCCQHHSFDEGHQLAEDQPDVDHLDVRGGGQALHLADEDGGHHQHGGQVHGERGLEEDRLEEGGGVGDRHEEDGGEVGGHHLGRHLPPHPGHHLHALLGVRGVGRAEGEVGDVEEGQVELLLHPQGGGDKLNRLLIQGVDCHQDEAFLDQNNDHERLIDICLGVEGVAGEYKVALEAVSIRLHHLQVVLAPLEHLHLVNLRHHHRQHDDQDVCENHLKLVAPGEVALPVHNDAGTPLPGDAQPSCQLNMMDTIECQSQN